MILNLFSWTLVERERRCLARISHSDRDNACRVGMVCTVEGAS